MNPARMAWSAVSLPAWVRWYAIGIIAAAGALLFWTLHALGMNLTDTEGHPQAHHSGQ